MTPLPVSVRGDSLTERGGFEPSRLFRMSRGAVAHHPGDRGWPITRIPRSTLAVAVMSSFKLCSQREKSPMGILERRFRKSLRKRVRRGFRGYPVATVVYYGPDDQRASKVAVGITNGEGREVA